MRVQAEAQEVQDRRDPLVVRDPQVSRDRPGMQARLAVPDQLVALDRLAVLVQVGLLEAEELAEVEVTLVMLEAAAPRDPPALRAPAEVRVIAAVQAELRAPEVLLEAEDLASKAPRVWDSLEILVETTSSFATQIRITRDRLIRIQANVVTKRQEITKS
jgi:hypothetical protein